MKLDYKVFKLKIFKFESAKKLFWKIEFFKSKITKLIKIIAFKLCNYLFCQLLRIFTLKKIIFLYISDGWKHFWLNLLILKEIWLRLCKN